ncbi:MAG: hypothetical protein ACI845_003183 [Gammaproteobacteria bacterium]|jgi:hypothetical protein
MKDPLVWPWILPEFPGRRMRRFRQVVSIFLLLGLALSTVTRRAELR